MSRGGAREGAGRPSGARNKRTQERLSAIEAEGITPLAYLLSLMRNEGAEPGQRLDAAKAAAPYVHPRLNAVEHTGPDGGAIVLEVVRFADQAASQ